MIGFKSIFQGDHAGVEIATSAHGGILKAVGLLDECSRVVSGRPFSGDSLMEGLGSAACVWQLVVLACVGASHGVLFPRNAGDMQRILQRELRPPLQEGRPVLGVTSKQRASFLTNFGDWLHLEGLSLDLLLEDHYGRVDEINKLLVKFGRC